MRSGHSLTLFIKKVAINLVDARAFSYAKTPITKQRYHHPSQRHW